MKVKLQDIVDAIELGREEISTYLNLKTGQVHTFLDEELEAAKKKKKQDGQPDWFLESVEIARDCVKNRKNYLATPSEHDFNDYRIMEDFCMSLPVEEQREEMCFLIQGRGAFSNFRRGLDRYDLTEDWYRYKAEKLREFAIRWCEDHKLEYLDED